MTYLKSIIGLLLLSVLMLFCAPSNELTSDNNQSPFIPNWYSADGYASDSTTVSYFYVSQSVDSLSSIEMAKKVAEVELINNIDDRVEAYRRLQNESELWQSTDSIRQLRMAMIQLIGRSEMVHSVTQKEGRYYKNYIQLSISKNSIRSQLLDSITLDSNISTDVMSELLDTL